MPSGFRERACERCGKMFGKRMPADQRFCSNVCASRARPHPRRPNRQRVPRDYALLHRLYLVEGKGGPTIARMFGVAPITVRRVLAELGIERRSIGQSNRTMASRVTRAETTQRQQRLSLHEREVLSILEAHGYHPIALYALGAYNVDIAFPEHYLGFEITNGGWHRTSRKREQDIAKCNRLTAQGWTIIDLNHQRMSSADAATQIMSTLQELPIT